MTQDELEEEIKKLKEKVKELEQNTSKKDPEFVPQQKPELPNLGRVRKAFNPENISADIFRQIENKKKLEIPASVVNLSVIVTVISVNGRTMNELEVRWNRAEDPNYDHAIVWIKGYETNNELGTSKRNDPPYRKVTEVEDSPLTFRLEATGETVILAVQAVNQNGVGVRLKDLPTARFELPTQQGAPDVAEESNILS